MNSSIEPANLLTEAAEATASPNPAPYAGSKVRVSTPSKKMEVLLNQYLPALVRSNIEVEKRRVEARRVDGCIIGTGESDFTKGNTIYTLNHKEKTFQLIDVPGIEGDEKKYAHMVREAVAKAHLVFYVNGTNKKPEKATAEKIRSYLRRGTQVCPVINVRGNADAYEFEEDRISLESHGGAGNALKQTVGVLEAVLGRDVLLPGHCVQGLLGFSSLAVNGGYRNTSIHQSRNNDLVIQQSNYAKHFTSYEAMFEFSQMQKLAEVLHAKLGTFKQDIIESNKIKVRELLSENLEILKASQEEHRIFLNLVAPEFEKCRESILGALQSFERLTSESRKNLWSHLFNDLTNEADRIVADNFGENDHISSLIRQSVKMHQAEMDVSLNQKIEGHAAVLEDGISEAMKRLIQDVRRVDFQQRISFAEGQHNELYQTIDLEMGFGLREWGAVAFSIGSFALTGAGLGSFAGPIGTAIGASIGAVVGVLVSVMHAFSSKEKRIRKAQAIAQEKINDMRTEVMIGLPEEMKKLMAPLRKEIAETTLAQVDAIHISLTRPLDIIECLIALMTNIKQQLEKMPHGTIQAVQR